MDLSRRQFNHRMMAIPSSESNAQIFGVLLWLSTSYFYKKKIYPTHKNYLNFVFFSFGSLFASFGYANSFLSSPYTEAVRLNNINETEH